MQSSAGEIFTFGSYPHKWSYLEKYVCKKDNNKKWGSFSLIFILILMEVDFYWWMIIIGNALINQVSFNSHTFFTPQNPIFTSPIWTNYLVCVCVCVWLLFAYLFLYKILTSTCTEHAAFCPLFGAGIIFHKPKALFFWLF